VTAEQQLYRVLDANLNRLREGLRVLEEHQRLVCDDHGCGRIKALRHELRELVDDSLQAACLAARRAGDDVGAEGQTLSEAARADGNDLLAANCKRAQEAARVLEEYGKMLPGESFSRGIKKLRFALYELEQELLSGRRARVRRWFAFDRPAPKKAAAFYLVADEKFYPGSDLFADLARVLEAGIDILQWRQKAGSDASFLEKAARVRELCREFETPFVVNDRPDIALLVDADGLHLGQNDLPLDAARKLVGPGMPIGRSTHSLVQARRAVEEGADYLGFGPIFTTPSKANPDPVVGIDGLIEILKVVGDRPVVAIGGLDVDNLPEVVKPSRVPAVAVIRAVLAAPDPARAVRELKACLSW